MYLGRISVYKYPSVAGISGQIVSKPHVLSGMCPRPKGMSSEASHSNNAKQIIYGKVKAPTLKHLLRCNGFLGMIERSEAMEIAVDTEVLVQQTRK